MATAAVLSPSTSLSSPSPVSGASYRVSVTTRTVSCRLCIHKVARGTLRVDTIKNNTVRMICHAECFIRRGQGQLINIPDDLQDFDKLSQTDKDIIISYKTDNLSRQNSLPCNSNSDNQSSSTPRPSSQPVSVIVSSPALLSHNSSVTRASSQRNSQNDSQNGGSEHNNSQNSNITINSQESSLFGSSQNLVYDLTGDESGDLTDDYEDDDDEYDSDESGFLPPSQIKRPKLDTDSQGNLKMPDMLAGVSIPDGPARSGDECSVCLDPPVHPVTLPCGHIFCYTCAKGLTQQGASYGGGGGSCSLCRQDIPDDYLDNSQVISGALNDVDDDSQEDGQQWSWFYQGRNGGWWRFEERNSEDLETGYLSGKQELEMMICGQLYVINFVRMEQFQKNYPTRKRKIKRDLKNSDNKGIAGLQSNKAVKK